MIPIPPYAEQPTLGSWIAFQQQYGKDLDEWLREIAAAPPGPRRDIDLTSFHVERSYCLEAFFRDIPLETAQASVSVDAATWSFATKYGWIFDFEEIAPGPYQWADREWILPSPEIRPGASITFGEFIDSKAIAQNARETKASRWELIVSLAAIYLRPKGEAYSEALIYEGSDRIAEVLAMPLEIAFGAGRYFDALNKYAEETFSVFHPGSGPKAGRATTKHFEAWGWVNFLKSIAKTKIFDLPNAGLNSIECARLASAYDVLVFASEDKSYGEAAAIDMQEGLRK